MGELVTLANGLRVWTDPMPSLETAAIGVWIGAGAIDEAPSEGGLAHLLEHMAFKGTKRRSARAIAEEIESVGGFLNAHTSYQRTGYYARILKEDAEKALDIIADILTDPLFEEAELVKEREVVVQEIGEAADQPDDAVFDMLQAKMYAGHPLCRPILGTVESVRGHDAARLRAFMSRLYEPGNMVVAAAGRIEPDAVRRWAQDRFGAARPVAREAAPSPRYAGGAAHDGRDIEQTHIAFGFPAVGARHDDFFATRVFAEALGGGMSSRLFQIVREERGLAYSVYAYAAQYDEIGSLCAYVGTDAEHAAEAARLVRAEIESCADKMSEAEVDRARAMLKSSLLMSLESPAERTERASSQIFAFGAPSAPDEIVRRLDAVTVDDARACARRALEDGPPSLAMVGPGGFDGVRAALGL